MSFFTSSMMLQFCKLFIYRKNEELRKNAVDALCCLAHALGEDFTIFIPSIHKLLLKHRLRVLFLYLIVANIFFINILILYLIHVFWVWRVQLKFFFPHQHKEFEEIEGRLQRREPLILGSMAVSQRLSRRLPVEVISDPLDNKEIDPYEDGSDVQKHLRGHQVRLFFVYSSKDTSFFLIFNTHFVMYVTAVL